MPHNDMRVLLVPAIRVAHDPTSNSAWCLHCDCQTRRAGLLAGGRRGRCLVKCTTEHSPIGGDAGSGGDVGRGHPRGERRGGRGFECGSRTICQEQSAGRRHRPKVAEPAPVALWKFRHTPVHSPARAWGRKRRTGDHHWPGAGQRTRSAAAAEAELTRRTWAIVGARSAAQCVLN